MTKFLLNLFLQISKTLVNSKIQFLFGKEFSFAFGPASQPSRPPAFSPSGCARARPIPACAAVAYWPKYVSFFTLRNPATVPSPSVTAKWGPPVSSIFHLAPADPGHTAASLGHPAPPRFYLEMPSQAINFPALIPRVNPLLNHPPCLQWR
jgi:hypothetical protein